MRVRVPVEGSVGVLRYDHTSGSNASLARTLTGWMTGRCESLDDVMNRNKRLWSGGRNRPIPLLIIKSYQMVDPDQ